MPFIAHDSLFIEVWKHHFNIGGIIYYFVKFKLDGC
jgi:hypothetical protein